MAVGAAVGASVGASVEILEYTSKTSEDMKLKGPAPINRASVWAAYWATRSKQAIKPARKGMQPGILPHSLRGLFLVTRPRGLSSILRAQLRRRMPSRKGTGQEAVSPASCYQSGPSAPASALLGGPHLERRSQDCAQALAQVILPTQLALLYSTAVPLLNDRRHVLSAGVKTASALGGPSGFSNSGHHRADASWLTCHPPAPMY